VTVDLEALVRRAKKAYDQQAYQEAAEAYQSAQESYQARGEALDAAEMANNRSVALLQAGEAQAALEAVEDTPAIFAAGRDIRRQAMALGNQATAHAALGQKSEAEPLFRESAQLFESIGEKEMRLSVLSSLSRLQVGSGRYLEAVATMENRLVEVDRPNFAQRIARKILSIPAKLLQRGP